MTNLPERAGTFSGSKARFAGKGLEMAAVFAETTAPAGQALGPMTGRRYIESLKDGREVWIDGARVDDVTAHPAFKDMIVELARIYDLQNSPKYRDEMTCIDPATGRHISVSWLLPRSAEDLKHKRRNSELWNELTWGQLGRSPDILAPYIISALHLKDQFSAAKHPRCDFGENIENYYRYCMSRDLFLTHALGDPQVDRSTQPQNEQRASPRTRKSHSMSSRRPRMGLSSPAANSSRQPHRTVTNATCPFPRPSCGAPTRNVSSPLPYRPTAQV